MPDLSQHCPCCIPYGLQDLPAVIEEYLEIVDRVLFSYGFEPESCEFLLATRAENAVSCTALENDREFVDVWDECDLLAATG